MQKVYPHFTARLVPGDSPRQWKVAAFVTGEAGQELPFPNSGILIQTPQGIKRAIVRQSSATTLDCAILSTGVTAATVRIAPLFSILFQDVQLSAAMLGDLEEKYHRIERKDGRRAAVRWYATQLIRSTMALIVDCLKQTLNRYRRIGS